MPLSPEDRFAILDLMARYSQTIDSGDADGWAALFTDDGVAEGGGARYQGHDELRGFAVGFAQAPHTAGGRHWTDAHLIEGDGTSARHTSAWAFTQPTGAPFTDGVRTLASGSYEDDLVKVDGRWLFKHRRITADRT